MTPWYEVHGAGDPIVLLHGGMSDSTGWGMQTPALAERYQVYLYDRRGHGRTPDTDAPFSFDDMTDEAIEFLEEVVGGPARLVGWSDGGVVSLLVASKRPDLVPRHVLIGANFHHEGVLEDLDLGDDPDADDVAMFKAMYEEVAVDPAHWPQFFAKTARLWREEPTLTTDDLTGIAVPTLVLVGDDDAISLDHTVALYESLANAQLAVVPGTSHVLTMEKPDLVNQLILDYLGEVEPPAEMMPVRRK